ncbi:MAG: Ig-like domain-containing protein [Clostridia bacterium]|nr:Ig-like domain-containing protein [Clostridia bacterium]
MKKAKILAAVTAAAVLSVSGGLFAGCTDGHTHTYSEDWKNDANGHWHVATCDDLKEGDTDYKSGYAAHVWGDDNECDVCHYTKTVTPTPTPVTEYTVTLDVNGGTLPEGTETTLTTVSGKLSSLPTPTAPDGQKFDGWYTAKTEGTKVDAEYTFTGETKEVTIYAVYSDDTPTPGPETTIAIDKETLTLGIGNTEYDSLVATITNGEEGAEVVWSSDNPSVVAVGEENGYVEAFKPGAATITATIKDTEISATCEVTVEDGYYLIGGQDSAWNKCGVFGQSGVIYFMPTETEGIYSTGSIELPKLGSFQVAPVGDTSANWWQKAFNGNYIATDDEVLSKNSDNNIAVEKHGMYTITLDLTGTKAVVSCTEYSVSDDEDDEDVYYIIGTVNNWTTVDKNTNKDTYSAFTKNADGTYTLTTNLTSGALFKFALVGMAWNGALSTQNVKSGRIANSVTSSVQLLYGPSDYNMKAGVTGWYTFTITVANGTSTIDYTYSETEPTTTPVETPEIPEE